MESQQANQSNQLQDQQIQLEQQLRESLTAEKFFETNSGLLWTRVVQEEITLAIRDITSSKYEENHLGYLKRLADLQAYQKILKKMQVAAAPQRRKKIRQKMDESNG